MHSNFSLKYMVTSIVLLSIIVPSRHTRIGAWVNSKMYISILYNIINCHARVFYKKNRTNLDLLSIPRLWGEKTNTEYTGSLGYNSVFRVCYITSMDVIVILDTCSTIEIIICYHKYLVVHIKTRLDLLGIQTLRWDQRLQLQNFFMALGQQYIL